MLRKLIESLRIPVREKHPFDENLILRSHTFYGNSPFTSPSSIQFPKFTFESVSLFVVQPNYGVTGKGSKCFKQVILMFAIKEEENKSSFFPTQPERTTPADGRVKLNEQRQYPKLN